MLLCINKPVTSTARMSPEDFIMFAGSALTLVLGWITAAVVLVKADAKEIPAWAKPLKPLLSIFLGQVPRTPKVRCSSRHNEIRLDWTCGRSSVWNEDLYEVHSCLMALLYRQDTAGTGCVSVSQLETDGARFVSGASPALPASAVSFLLFREIVTRITATVAHHATSPHIFQSKVTSGSGVKLHSSRLGWMKSLCVSSIRSLRP